MEQKKSEKLSREQWKEIWREALKRGVCPFDPTHSLKNKTCGHLDDFLDWGQTRSFFEPVPEISPTATIEEFSTSTTTVVFVNTVGVWDLFKQLRSAGLSNEHCLILIRKHGLGQGRRLIMRELEMTSVSQFHKVLKDAEDELRSLLERL